MYLICRAFDLLALLLLAFPIFAGGFWIRRPHFKFELTELAVPTVIIFGLGFALDAWLCKKGTRIWEKSWTATKAREAFARWKNFLLARPAFAIGLGTIFVSLLWAYVSLRRNAALGSNGYDLGIFTNAIWNLSHGNGYLSSIKGGINLFSDHQSPIFWIFAPIFAAFPSPGTLLVIQAIALACGAGAVFVLARQYRAPALLLAAAPLLYWAYLPLRRANLFDFHPEVLMLPLFLWAIAGIQSPRTRPQLLGWVAFFAALACKESAGAVGAGIGLAWVLGAGPGESRKFQSKRSARGWIALAIGIAVFAFDLHEVPALVGGHYAYGGLYDHLLLGAGEWVRSLAGRARMRFLLATLAPLGFLPLLAPRALIAAIPGYLMLFLSVGDLRLSLQFHYAIEPAVGLFWALAASGTAIPERLPRITQRMGLGLWIGFWALICFGRSEVYWIRHYEPSPRARWLQSEVARCLSPTASLTASGPLVPHVATRRWIQQIPDLGRPGEPDNCVWLDSSLDNWPIGNAELAVWENRLASEGYQKFFECGPTRIYQRQNFSGACLRCMPECPTSFKAP